MRPIGLLLYVVADKEPKPGTHNEFTHALWEQGVGSTMHCAAGDATGIIVAALVVTALGLPMTWDVVVEYVASFTVGLFIFQALFMKSAMGGSHWENVRRPSIPELISMNVMMAGMAPVMVLMIGRDMAGHTAHGALVLDEYEPGRDRRVRDRVPVNVWMVSRHMKQRPWGSRFDVPRQALAPQSSPAAHHSGGAALAGEHSGHPGGHAPHRSVSRAGRGNAGRTSVIERNRSREWPQGT
ncbi:hypothetical protein HNQ07_003993 [Deinococcus metalli]|uniref:DUF4396 domain-containing protein n=1 Tax=Deinococcus metalli TaxID=1141878 RepID=A0A7W8NR27_9DEIO|nr:DUF4396 domain-containing protein [Deinococcus metalli]MBB5378486.1 hypothetical protein [Deinococcus metalli]GHF58065.1 hypothetical protein GCM10017781_37860 [Deinococcus metalli]